MRKKVRNVFYLSCWALGAASFGLSEEKYRISTVESHQIQEAGQTLIRAANGAIENDPDSDLRNFHKISDEMYRSARLEKRGLEKLYKLGFKTILNLEGKGDYKKEREILDQIEKDGIEKHEPSLHINSENIPMSGSHAPKFEQIDNALSILADASRRPILVHCKHGQDRAGIVIAAYRIEIERSMTIDEAVQEAKSYHCCHLVLRGGDALKNFLTRYHQHRSGTASASLNY